MKRLERTESEKGFTLMEALIIVLVLAVIGFAGWWVWQNNQDKSKKAAATTQTDTSKTGDEQEDEEPSMISLLNGKVTLTIPAGWKESAPPYPCQAPTDKTSCQAQDMIVPVEGPKTQSNDLFGVNVNVFTASSAATARDWFLQKYEGGQPGSADKTSIDAINGNSTYYYRQNAGSYSDIWYVFLKDDRVVTLYARVSEKHFGPDGQVDQSSDYTRYVDAISEFAKSIDIK